MTAWGGSSRFRIPVGFRPTRQLGAGLATFGGKRGVWVLHFPAEATESTSQSLPANVTAMALALIVSVTHKILADVCSCFKQDFVPRDGARAWSVREDGNTSSALGCRGRAGSARGSIGISI